MKDKISHRFLDEAGDPTFFKKGRILAIGEPGISLAFSLGMVKFNCDLHTTRAGIQRLEDEITKDEYLNRINSVAKKISKGGFYFHATDDPPEVRERMFRFIREVDCSIEMVVARKKSVLFAKKHHSQHSEFYADLLSHLIKNKLKLGERLVLNIADRGASTKNINLSSALEKAYERFKKRWNIQDIRSTVVFNIQTSRTEPLLCVADYLCWSIQRVFERGEMRHYEFIRDKVSLVVDLYDTEKYKGGKNFYTQKNPLTVKNKLSPPLP
ncbi:MAG: DUF3800 domain-containing protein [Candidatus Aminicenantales bacterium]